MSYHKIIRGVCAECRWEIINEDLTHPHPSGEGVACSSCWAKLRRVSAQDDSFKPATEVLVDDGSTARVLGGTR